MTSPHRGLVPRRLAPIVRSRMAEEPVVLLQDPRSVGKSTLPLSQGELRGTRERFLDDLFTEPALTVAAAAGTPSQTSREEYIDAVTTGGFPPALGRASLASRNRWFDDYVSLSLERDVQDVSRIRQAALLPALLERLAGQTAQVLAISRAASGVRLDERTAQSYVRLLEAVFLLYRLPAWGTTLTARSTASPKIHVLDSGVAARLMRLTPAKLAARSPTALTEFGHLLETFAVTELLKQVSWADWLGGVGHWRTRNGDEVDLVVERDDGALVAFEVRAAGRVPGEDLAPLRKLRDAAGDAFLAGVALCLGSRSYTHEDRLHVMPVDRIWAP